MISFMVKFKSNRKFNYITGFHQGRLSSESWWQQAFLVPRLLILGSNIQLVLPLLVRESLSSLVVNHAWLTAETSSVPNGDISSSWSFCKIFKKKKKGEGVEAWLTPKWI